VQLEPTTHRALRLATLYRKLARATGEAEVNLPKVQGDEEKTAPLYKELQVQPKKFAADSRMKKATGSK